MSYKAEVVGPMADCWGVLDDGKYRNSHWVAEKLNAKDAEIERLNKRVEFFKHNLEKAGEYSDAMQDQNDQLKAQLAESRDKERQWRKIADNAAVQLSINTLKALEDKP